MQQLENLDEFLKQFHVAEHHEIFTKLLRPRVHGIIRFEPVPGCPPNTRPLALVYGPDQDLPADLAKLDVARVRVAPVELYRPAVYYEKPLRAGP